LADGRAEAVFPLAITPERRQFVRLHVRAACHWDHFVRSCWQCASRELGGPVRQDRGNCAHRPSCGFHREDSADG
jgi:hypothetical protein